jgi:putative glutamine amidotransferase
VRPLIAITTWRRELSTFVGPRTLLYTLADEYVRCVADGGATPLLIPHLIPDEVDSVLDGVDGLVVAGGGDVDPVSYGASDAGSSGTDPKADATEIALVRAARAREVPVLAICRGMQIANVAFGGSLTQDIGQVGTAHEPISDDPDAVLGAIHDIVIAPASLLGRVLGAGPRTVNTIHHQAIDRLAEGFQVTARAEDGVIEAIETDDAWPFLGVQWHPEKRAGNADAPLFDWVRDAALAARTVRSP